MHIDGCHHTFEELARTVLPGYMKKLYVAHKTPHPSALFSSPSKGPVSIANELKLPGDLSGCYVLIEKEKPIYAGISRGVFARLRQHFTGNTHFDASLAYAIAQRRLPTPGKRSEVMRLLPFKSEFAAAQTYLRSLDVAFVEIQNPLELYVFEAFAAIELRTHQWNTFRTH